MLIPAFLTFSFWCYCLVVLRYISSIYRNTCTTIPRTFIKLAVSSYFWIMTISTLIYILLISNIHQIIHDGYVFLFQLIILSTLFTRLFNTSICYFLKNFFDEDIFFENFLAPITSCLVLWTTFFFYMSFTLLVLFKHLVIIRTPAGTG